MGLVLVFVLLLIILAIWTYFRPSEPESIDDSPDITIDLEIKQPIQEPTEFDSEPDLVWHKPTTSQSEPTLGYYMSREDKQTYLRSAEWYELRATVFERDNFMCQSCGSKHRLECHHITYERLGAEPLHHLTTLCRDCHQAIHDKLGYDRTTYYPIKDLTNAPFIKHT